MHSYTLLRANHKIEDKFYTLGAVVDIKSKLEIIYLKILLKKQQLWTTVQADT